MNKQMLICGFLICGFSQYIIANNKLPDQTGDPKKETQTTTFTLSNGYFSLFNCLKNVPVQITIPDTAKTMVPEQKNKVVKSGK